VRPKEVTPPRVECAATGETLRGVSPGTRGTQEIVYTKSSGQHFLSTLGNPTSRSGRVEAQYAQLKCPLLHFSPQIRPIQMHVFIRGLHAPMP
jgi:hypothetical protein